MNKIQTTGKAGPSFNQILAHHRRRFKVGDWRRPGYDARNWNEGVLLRDWNAGKQNVILRAGTTVAWQTEKDRDTESGFITFLLHTELMCPTSVGPKPDRYIDRSDDYASALKPPVKSAKKTVTVAVVGKLSPPGKKRKEPTQAELEAAFDEVKNKKNWKMPISKLIFRPSVAKAALIVDAVIHFTGGMCEIIPAAGGRVRVQGPGYYNSVGA